MSNDFWWLKSGINISPCIWFWGHVEWSSKSIVFKGVWTLIGILGHNPTILFIMKPLPDVIVCECKDEKLREPLPEGDNSGNSG